MLNLFSFGLIFFFFIQIRDLLRSVKLSILGWIGWWYHLTIVPLMYYLSEKGCSFVIVTKSTCLKIHALAPSCFWSVCRSLSHRVSLCSHLEKQSSILASVLQLLRGLCGSEQDVMKQTWLLCSWPSCMARLPGPWLAMLQLTGLWLG